MKKNFLWGILLILAGVYYLLTELGVLTLNLLYLLPAAMLALTVYVQVCYFRENCYDTGKPVASGLFLALAVIFFFCVKDGWDSFRTLYPVILLGLSVGIVEEILTRKGRSGSWFLAVALAAVGLVLLFGMRWSDMWRYGLPVALILTGATIILRPGKKQG